MVKKSRSGTGAPPGNPPDDAADDDTLWQLVMRGVTPYHARNQREPAPLRVAAKMPARRELPVTALPPVTPAATAVPRGFDRATETKMKKGKLPIDGRIDLHGLTQEEARRRLIRFIETAVATGKRTVLVITGKGAKSEGVLKRMFPVWLSDRDVARHVIGTSTAAPKDGGTGAFYVRLRRPRGGT
jgi:DNA-nicking Smr family endonuclease